MKLTIQIVSLAIVLVMAFSVYSVAVYSINTSQPDVTIEESKAAKIETLTDTLTMNLCLPMAEADEGGFSWYLALKVNYSVFPYPLYFWSSCRGSSDNTTSWTLDNTSYPLTQTVSGNRWYINMTDGYLKYYYEFQPGIVDASGDKTLDVYANFTHAANPAKYNGSALAMYIGVNSYVDHVWLAALKASTFYDYYGIGYSYYSWKSVKFENHYWFQAISNSASYWTAPPAWSGSNYATGWKISICDGREMFKGNGTMTFKFVHENPLPTTAPMLLHMFPWDSTTGRVPYYITSVFDNPSIYAKASNLGFQSILMHERWMVDGTYDAYNASVGISLNNIINYTHANGMDFGFYFGWLHGTNWGSLTQYNASALAVAENCWTNFSSKWLNKIDFVYFDSAIMDWYSNPCRNWSGMALKLLDPIFKTIMAAGKTIIHNSYGGQIWWADDEHIFPLKGEGVSWSAFTTQYMDLRVGDSVRDSMNHSAYFWPGPIWDDVFSNPYQTTRGLGFISRLMDWGISPDYPFHIANLTGFTPFTYKFSNLTGSLTRLSSVSGASGKSGIFTDANDVRVYTENAPATITYSGPYGDGYRAAYCTINGTSTSLTLDLTGRPDMLRLEFNGTVMGTFRGSDPITFTATNNLYHLEYRYSSSVAAIVGVTFDILVVGVIGVIALNTVVIPLRDEKQRTPEKMVKTMLHAAIYIVIALSLLGVIYTSFIA